MQKREGFRFYVVESPMPYDYIPQPRECATLTTCGQNVFLVGGNGTETIAEMSWATVGMDHLKWKKVKWDKQESLEVQGRQQHSTCAFRHYLYIFGGCFAFNRKRHTRESTNSIFELNTLNG